MVMVIPRVMALGMERVMGVHRLIDLIESTRVAQREEPREYLGCSSAGHPCDRALWLTHRWASRPKFTARQIDAMNSGNDAEKRVITNFVAAGLHVTNQQAEVKFSDHFRGHIDGEVNGQLLEIKELKHSRVLQLHRHGVRKAEFGYYVQVQLYMLGRGLPPGDRDWETIRKFYFSLLICYM